jgi:hypothetical protein
VLPTTSGTSTFSARAAEYAPTAIAASSEQHEQPQPPARAGVLLDARLAGVGSSTTGAPAARRARSSAAMNSSASGSGARVLLSARITTASSAGGSPGRAARRHRRSETCLSAIETGDSASNGTRPVSSS